MRTSTHRRRALTLVALLAVVAPTAGCGEAGSSGGAAPAGGGVSTGVPGASETPAPPSTDATDGSSPSGAGASVIAHGVRLEATFEIGFPEQPTGPGVRRKPGVVVTYTLAREGGSAGELVAYDVVPDSLGSAGLPPDVNPEHAWVYAAGGAVRISKQSFAPAPGITFVAAPTTGVRVIPADGTLQGRAYAVTPAELDLPAAEFTAPRGPLQSGSSSWQFCVQVGERLPGMRPSAVGQGVLEAPVRAPEGDELVCTEPVTLTSP